MLLREYPAFHAVEAAPVDQAQHFAKQMRLEYDILIARAVLMTDILMGVTGAAGQLVVRDKLDHNRIVEMVVHIILTAVGAVAIHIDEAEARRSTKA